MNWVFRKEKKMEQEKSLVKLIAQGKIKSESYYFDVETNTFLGNGNDFTSDIVKNYYLNKSVHETNFKK